MGYNSRPLPALYQRGDPVPLGLGNPLAVATAVAQVGGLISQVHFLQYPKDKERRDNADALYARALAGDTVAEAQLRLLSHVGTEADMATMRAAGLEPGCIGDIPGGCGWATDWAQKYGQAKLLELQARRAAGQIGGTLIGQSDIPARMGAAVGDFFASPWVWVAGGVLVVLLIRRRGRRYRANPRRRARRRRSRARARR